MGQIVLLFGPDRNFFASRFQLPLPLFFSSWGRADILWIPFCLGVA